MSFSLADLERIASDFSSRLLDGYVGRVSKQKRKPQSKEINDALWGTVSLAPFEVLIFDSPLLQRLRNIKQLGVVHWVYPSAVHSRFEHTLGVLHQVQQLINALNSAATRAEQPALIDKSHSNLLRLCALIHDVGHGAFSHVTEMALEALPEINILSANFSRTIKRSQGDSIQDKFLSEIFCYYIVRSQSFRALISNAVDVHSGHISLEQSRASNIDMILEKVSRAVIGLPIHKEMPLLHELVSGPFDADKLDYFARDAKFAGIPNVLDISRLTQKVGVRTLQPSELPPEISPKIQRGPTQYHIFGIKWSGAAVIDELHLARLMLYSKIYKHQKVKAIERMVREVMELIASVASAETAMRFTYEYSDDEFLALTDSRDIARAIRVDPDTLEDVAKKKLTLAARIIGDLRQRRLFVKAFQIHAVFPGDPLEKDDSQVAGLVSFIETAEHPQKSRDLQSKLVAETRRALELLGGEAPIAPTELLEHQVLIFADTKSVGSAQFGRAFLLPTVGAPIPFKKYMVSRMAWADNYMAAFPKGYVFAPLELSPIVYVALEKLLRSEYGIRLPPSALEMGKQDASEIDAIKHQLAKEGYYLSTPYDVRPRPKRLDREDVEATVKSFLERVAPFEEPVSGASYTVGGGGADIDRKEIVYRWLRQFESDEYIECAVHMLSRFKVIGRREIVAAARTFIDANPAFKGAVAVPFGNLKDSTALSTYYVKDLGEEYISECLDLRDVIGRNKQSNILFIDDIICSGGQSRDMLSAWFGDTENRVDLGEERDLFDEAARKYLLEKRVGFIFAAGWDSGLETLAATCSRLGLKHEIFALTKEAEIPFAFRNCFDGFDRDLVRRFKERCSMIGESLLRSELAEIADEQRRARMEEKLPSRLLGYGNEAMLLASTANVPTQVMSLVWKSGLVEGAIWHPLMRRRKKT